MVVIHLFEEEPKDFRKLIRNLYPKDDISVYTMTIYANKVGKRFTAVIHSDDIEPIESIDLFLRMKYPTYNGYTVQPPTYDPAKDYTYVNNLSGVITTVITKEELF